MSHPCCYDLPKNEEETAKRLKRKGRKAAPGANGENGEISINICVFLDGSCSITGASFRVIGVFRGSPLNSPFCLHSFVPFAAFCQNSGFIFRLSSLGYLLFNRLL